LAAILNIIAPGHLEATEDTGGKGKNWEIVVDHKRGI